MKKYESNGYMYDLNSKILNGKKKDIQYMECRKLVAEIEEDLNTPIKKILSCIYLPTKYRNKINLAYQHLKKGTYIDNPRLYILKKPINTINYHSTADDRIQKVEKKVGSVMKKIRR